MLAVLVLPRDTAAVASEAKVLRLVAERKFPEWNAKESKPDALFVREEGKLRGVKGNVRVENADFIEQDFLKVIDFGLHGGRD